MLLRSFCATDPIGECIAKRRGRQLAVKQGDGHRWSRLWSTCSPFLLSCNVVSLQDADAAVALNLFFSRITEQAQPCHEMMLALAAALPKAQSALQAYEAVHSVADEAASAARAAHQQVLEAQVCFETKPWHKSYVHLAYFCLKISIPVVVQLDDLNLCMQQYTKPSRAGRHQ